LIAILSLLPLFVNSPYTLHILILSFIYVIASVSLRAITISGQFPLAHGAFMGIGAYVAGMTSRWFGWPAWITIPFAATVAAGLGIITGYPFARLRALYYAMGSLFFGIGVIQIIHAGGIWTGGYSGLTGIHPIFTGSKVPYYYFLLGLALISIVILYRIEFSRIGTNLKAISQSHVVASSVGINEGFYRILAVAVGCFFVGLAGACYAHYNLILSSGTFGFMGTLWLVTYVLVGGIDRLAGPIIGTFILFLIPELFRDLRIYSPFISAAILLIVVYLMPQGLVGLPQVVRQWLRVPEKDTNVSPSRKKERIVA
jgi:branched-chain amino acid transport system permease protein